MKKVLLNSRLLINFIEEKKIETFSKDFGCLWKILKEDSGYQGYISTVESKKLLRWLEEIYDYDGGKVDAKLLLDDFLTVLNDDFDENKITFDYVVTEDVTSLNPTSKNVNIAQFLIRYELDYIYNRPLEEGASEPLYNLKINFIIEDNINSTASKEENDLLCGDDNDNLERDSLTGFNGDDIIVGEENDLLCGDDNNYLFDNLERDSLTGFNGDDIIVGEKNDLLCGDDNDNLERDSLTNSLRSDSFFTDIYENNNQNDIFDSNQ